MQRAYGLSRFSIIVENGPADPPPTPTPNPIFPSSLTRAWLLEPHWVVKARAPWPIAAVARQLDVPKHLHEMSGHSARDADRGQGTTVLGSIFEYISDTFRNVLGTLQKTRNVEQPFFHKYCFRSVSQVFRRL